MKIENLKCHDYKVVSDTLIAIVTASGLDEIKSELFGKESISVTTDNLEAPQIVEELIGFEKGKSILADLENNLYTVTITRKTDYEKRLEALENILLSTQKFQVSEEGNITSMLN